MSRILLVDDSPHAQRMGERILTEEGFEVVTVSNADSALIRMEDVDPDVILADTVMPGRSGYEICHFVKMSPRHRHVRVVLTAGVLEPLDEEQAKRVEADGTLKKPFEASVLLATVKPLVERAVQDRAQLRSVSSAPKPAAAASAAAVPFVAVVDAEQVRAAVTVALDAAMENMVEEISKRVLAALQIRKSAGQPQPAVAAAPAAPEAAAAPKAAPQPSVPTFLRPLFDPKKPPESPAAPPRLETIRRVSPLRSRPGSILGLDLSYGEREVPSASRPSAGESPFVNARPAADPDPGSLATAPNQPAAGAVPGLRSSITGSPPSANPVPGSHAASTNPPAKPDAASPVPDPNPPTKSDSGSHPATPDKK